MATMSVVESIIKNEHKHVLYHSDKITADQSLTRSEEYLSWLDERRSVRDFSTEAVDKKVIENIIMSASTAPSGAHKQPWTFCAISNPDLKSAIRVAAEKEEKLNYDSRMSDTWKQDLAAIGTDMNKPFIEDAPWVIVAFKQIHGWDEDGGKTKNYYVNESVGIAAGMLISAIHNAGLVTLTHTPSPMNFLERILERPSNERAFLLLPVGYAHSPAYVPDIKRKPLNEVAVFYE